MSYTIPDYVDTKEQAVLALASTIKGEAVTGGDGSVNRALDILADVLAERDVQVPQTNAGAILALAQYVTGGGGGSSDLTTATVTIVNNTSSSITVMMPVTADDPDGSFSMPMLDLNNDRTGEFTAIMYKGHATAFFDSVTLSIEGSATNLAGSAVDITGDCSITVS